MKHVAALMTGFLLSTTASAALGLRDNDDPDAPRWEEEAMQLPAFPQEAGLREFYVSATTTHKYYIDATTLSAGKDGVVRYTLVVRTGGGATNIGYEGMRCQTREYKIFATGSRDGNWVPARRSEWRPVENKPINRHHAALAREYFCPGGTAILSAEEGREALRLGKHPLAD